MQVNAKMPETRVDREKVGQKVLIKVNALRDETITAEGEVVDIAPLPDVIRFFDANVKVYTTHIRLTNASPKLRPGMGAQVEILLAEHDNALTIPIGAVIRLDGKERVAVKNAKGGFDWREVDLGDSSEAEVQVKQGLKTGEHVALDPLKLLNEEERGRAKAQSPWLTKLKEQRDRAADARSHPLRLELRQKMWSLDPGERAKLKSVTPAEREAILKKAGFTDAELRQIEERIKQIRRPN